MKLKRSQRLTRRDRQIRNHGECRVITKMFSGEVYWQGTVATLHAAKELKFNGTAEPGMPEPLLNVPSTTDAVVAAEYAIADAHGVRLSAAIVARE